MTSRQNNKPIIDFDYIKALNNYIDGNYLNKVLNTLHGGSSNITPSDVTLYRINNTNTLVNLYPDAKHPGTMLLHDVYKIPNEFDINGEMNKLNIEDQTGGAKQKKAMNKDKKIKPKPKSKSKSGNKKGGASEEEPYEQDYDEIDILGGAKKSTQKPLPQSSSRKTKKSMFTE